MTETKNNPLSFNPMSFNLVRHCGRITRLCRSDGESVTRQSRSDGESVTLCGVCGTPDPANPFKCAGKCGLLACAQCYAADYMNKQEKDYQFKCKWCTRASQNKSNL